MSKWRPSPTGNLFVIPDVHGQLNQLKLICNRIFPLRKSNGTKDILIMLGDYIDRLPEAHLVVDYLIEAKKQYKDQLILLKGNHEDMLLKAIKPQLSSFDYRMWMNNGGTETLSGYLTRAGEHLDNPFLLARNRIIDFIPKEHIDFFKSLLHYYEVDNYIFVHGGCDPFAPLSKQSAEELIWDRGLFEIVKQDFVAKKTMPTWDKIIITGHNTDHSGYPFVIKNFMMLDCSATRKLFTVELRSMECFYAEEGNGRLVKYQLIDRLSV